MTKIIQTLALLASVLACPTAGSAAIRVIDGDTLSDGDITYRLNGIDAPESGQTCLNSSGQSWRCGETATAFLVDLLANTDLRCQAIEQDRYGRTIATCFASGMDLGKSLIEAGLAWSFRRYDDVYAEAEDTAKKDGRLRNKALPKDAPSKGTFQRTARSTMRLGLLGILVRRSRQQKESDGFVMKQKPLQQDGALRIGTDNGLAAAQRQKPVLTFCRHCAAAQHHLWRCRSTPHCSFTRSDFRGIPQHF
ncbi:MAG: thermonuclease family protein [Donghicola eburneus]|nr:thermonuclease family protein [Donghicola eburneus]MCI5038177.1 thermonuclease family protein [Donghicola eburneus]